MRGTEVRRRYPDRWTRFYTLPDGERIARTDEQRAEQLHRYLSVLDALGAPQLLITWGLDLPATAWRGAQASAVDTAEDLVPLLRAVADDRAHDVIVAPADVRWLFHPYDGGMDVIGGEVDFPEWRSPRSDGL